MSNETKPVISRRGINVDEWRKQNVIPSMNQPKQEITGCAFFPKHDPAILQAYAKKHNLKF